MILLASVTGVSAPAAASAPTVCATKCPFSSIQEAVDSASPGSVIIVKAGTYHGGITIEKSLTLNGAGTGSTVIQGGNPVITVGSGVETRMTHLTITGGDGDFGGGIANSGDLTLDQSVVTGNTAREQGGGIFNNGSLVLQNVTVNGNRAETPFGSGGGIKNDGSLTMRNTTVTGNHAPAGGGIDNSGRLTVMNSQVTGNGANLGGGIANSGLLSIRNSAINDNTVDGDPAVDGGLGGGIYNTGTVTVEHSQIKKNTASADPYGVNEETGFGGGIFNENGGVTLDHVVVSQNQADRDGGGIYNHGGTISSNHSRLQNNIPNDCVGCS